MSIRGTPVKRFGRNLRILLRTERLIARRHLDVALRRGALYALAGLVALIALVMLNVAAFHALAARMTPQLAALLVAVGNLVLALILVAVAARMKPGAELEPVTELRDLALAEIETDLDGAVEEARELSANVRRIARDPLGTALPSLLGALLSLLLSGRKK